MGVAKTFFIIVGILSGNVICCQSNFTDKIDGLLLNIVEDGKVDYKKAQLYTMQINELVQIVESYDLDNKASNEEKAFLINAYNLITISNVVKNYPTTSVQKIANFFTKDHIIAKKKMSLDNMEKALFSLDKDFRIHFAIVCGAKDCPPLQPTAYRYNILEEQLNLAASMVVNSPKYITTTSTNSNVSISKLFLWNQDHLTDGEQSIIPFINAHRLIPINEESQISYLPYNWSLNDVSVSAGSTGFIEGQYFTSQLYALGDYEVRLFNNYYTQRDFSNGGLDTDKRANFYSIFTSVLFGINNRVNVGLELKARSANQNFRFFSSSVDALRFANEDYQFDIDGPISYSRFGLTAIAPIIKYQPFRTIPNISFQHTLYIPIGKSLQGNAETGFLDWASPVLNNQVFYDHIISDRFSIFAEVGFSIENIDKAIINKSSGFYQFSTPMTMIFNYYWDSSSTVFALINAAPRWTVSVDENLNSEKNPDAYSQYGIGYKYFFTEKFQMEVLYTSFNSALRNRRASTVNVGFRYFQR